MPVLYWGAYHNLPYMPTAEGEVAHLAAAILALTYNRAADTPASRRAAMCEAP